MSARRPNGKSRGGGGGGVRALAQLLQYKQQQQQQAQQLLQDADDVFDEEEEGVLVEAANSNVITQANDNGAAPVLRNNNNRHANELAKRALKYGFHLGMQATYMGYLMGRYGNDYVQHTREAQGISARGAKILAENARGATSVSRTCLAGCTEPILINFSAALRFPTRQPYKFCSIECKTLSAAHKRCMRASMTRDGIDFIALGCPGCGSKLTMDRSWAWHWRNWIPSLRLLMVWIWSNFFFWPFVCYWPMMFTFWVGALSEYYAGNGSHPGNPLWHGFRFTSEDIDFKAWVWWHRWTAAMAGYAIAIFFVIVWNCVCWLTPNKIKNPLGDLWYKYE